MHWLTLAFRMAGYLGWCVGIYFGCLVAWTLLRGSRPEHARRWMNWIGTLKRFKEKGTWRISETWVALGFASGISIILIMGAERMKYPVAEEHNVAVLRQLSNSEWVMRSDEEGDFVYRACPDFPNEKVIWPGYVARKARWQERGECKSIRDTGLGFWWRDENNQYRRVN